MAIISPVVDGDIIKNPSKSESEEKTNDLGYDQFLQLLCAEMQYQDPLEPTSNTDYVAQLATFSQVEATLNMQNALTSLQANDLVGKYVILADGEGGFVDYTEYTNGNQYLYVNGSRYTIADIFQVVDADYMEAMTLADAFAGAVAKLPDPNKLTLDDLESVQELELVFKSLTSYQKSMIDSDVMTKYNALIKQMATLLGDISDEDKDNDQTTDGDKKPEDTGGTTETE